MRIGKITENALKRSVLKLLRTEYKDVKSAAVGSDCAFSANKEAFSTVSSVTADTRDPGFYAVAKALIGLFSQGITPDHVSVSIMLPVLKILKITLMRICFFFKTNVIICQHPISILKEQDKPFYTIPNEKRNIE